MMQLTFNQERLIRSIKLKLSSLPKERIAIMTELLLIKSTYGTKDEGITFELALTDLYERVKELECTNEGEIAA